MKKYALIIDVAKCENCNSCFLACKDEHCGNDWPGYTDPQPLHGHRWLDILARERGAFPQVDVAYLPKPCQHCGDAPCVRAGQGAVVKRPDGIVAIDPEKAKGKKNLVAACPYEAIWWNEELQVPQKCTLCAHLLDGGWRVPRCVQACPTGALTFFAGTDEELAAAVRDGGLEHLDAGGPATRPRVWYKNLHRFTSDCIFGSIATTTEGGVTECVAGATVRLKDGGTIIDEQKSDGFGDFRFDRLAPAHSRPEYTLEIVDNGRTAATVRVETDRSPALGTIWIKVGGQAEG